MSRFFISYRREDGSGYAGRIYDHLVQSFGQDRVFMDVDAIEPGHDFVEVIQNAVGSCSALIAVVGRNWLGARPDGSRRIDDPEDFVHLEVATALERGVRVIPVLVDEAETPKSTELPPRLQALARRNAVRASHTSFRAGIDSLIRALAKVEAPAEAKGPASLPVPETASQPIPIEQARVSRLDIPEDIYGGIFLSPNGRDLYLSRLRERIGWSQYYDLMHFDLQEGDLTWLADIGSDGAYYAGFVGDLFYKTRSLEEPAAHQILCFQRQQSVSDPIEKQVVNNFTVVGDNELILKLQDGHHRWNSILKYSIKMDLGEAAKAIVWSHPRQPLVLVSFQRLSGSASEGKDALSEYHLIERGSIKDVKSSRCVLVESKTRRYGNFTRWTDDLLLFEESFDSNGDGTVDHTDERNEIVRALNLRTGGVSSIVSEPANRMGLGGHPSGGRVYFLEEIARDETYALRTVDTKTSKFTGLAVLQGGRYGSCQFDSAVRFAVCQRVVDTTGLKRFHFWQNRSSIYRIDLPSVVP